MVRTPLVLVAGALALPACKREADRPAGLAAGSVPAEESAKPPAVQPPPPPPPETATPLDPKQTISGTIVLPAARKANVARGDTIYVIARRAGGPPGPGSMLAVQRLQAGDFPMRFTISGRDAMVPGTPFEGPVSITVRVDKDGDAMTRRKGDVHGRANDIKVGSQDVAISLDTLQAEDINLGGGAPGAPPAPGQGLPPGHP